MKLVISEKPSVGMEIAKVIGTTEKKNSYLKGNGYIVSWCYGHLVSLAQPQDYDEKYKKWHLKGLPIIPQDYKLIINEETKDHFYMLKNLMNRDDIEEIICATDSGREGELIFRLVYEKAKCKKPVKRLWISSLTEESIRKGFKNLEDSSKYDGLYEAGLKRLLADWIVGMNATRMYSVKYGNKITIGRVQTPTLAILVNRENEIKRFKKEKNYKILLEKDNLVAESKVFEKEKEVKEVYNKIKEKEAICVSLEKKVVNENPPKLYDLTLLQRDCNKKLGLTAQETLNIAQSLYEKKVLSYPRTDSNFISSDMKDDFRYIVGKLYKDFKILDEVNNISLVINDKKVSDHHAIIPTKNISSSAFEKLNYNEKQVLKMVCKRLVEAIDEKAIFEESLYELRISDVDFSSKYKILKEEGYLRIERFFFTKKEEEYITDKNKSIEIKKGDVLSTYELRIHEYFTQAPKRYTEARLLSAMENSCNKEYKEHEGDYEKKGLGTVATRAGIIEKLIKVGYIERKNKVLEVTEKGINAIKIVDEKIKSPSMTTEWEVKLQDIERKKYDSSKFLEEIIKFVEEFINNNKVNENIKKEMQNLNEKSKEKEIIGVCPKCKNNIYEAEKNFYCSNKECDFSLFKEDRFFTSKKVNLTKTQVKKLLKDGEVEFKKLYSEKKDKFYSAKVSFELKGKYVNYKMNF